MERPILAYDAGCGPCASFRGAVEFFDLRKKIRYISLESAEIRGLLETVAPELRYRSFQLVLEDGRVLSGTDAVPALLRLLPGGQRTARFLELVPLGMASVRFLYSALSRLHETGSCGRPLPNVPHGNSHD